MKSNAVTMKERDKKILIFTNNSGGLYDFRRELLTELLVDGNEVKVYTPLEKKVTELKKLGVELNETTMSRRGMNPLKDFSLFWCYRKILKSEKPDMVITYTIKPNIYGGFACRLAGIPYAINVTGLGTAFQKEGLLKKLIVFLYRLSCKRAKVIFFENEANRQLFVEMKIARESQTCRLNGAGVNLAHFTFQEYPVHDKYVFLFIGRIMKEKGIDELLEAMKRIIADGFCAELHVLGSFEEEYGEKVEKYSKEGWLVYYGYQNDVRPFIAEADCFVLPSWHEGMANTNLECAASGRPVITSNIPGCREAVLEGKSGFLAEKKNSEDLYRVMKRFAEMSIEERKEMGLCGRKHMEEIFDKKKVVEETVKRLFQEK